MLHLGWQILPLLAQLLVQHGHLMVSGFFGILISLERRVAISQVRQGRKIYYLPSLLAGLGVIAFFLPIPAAVPRAFMTFAALGLTIIFVIIYHMQP